MTASSHEQRDILKDLIIITHKLETASQLFYLIAASVPFKVNVRLCGYMKGRNYLDERTRHQH